MADTSTPRPSPAEDPETRAPEAPRAPETPANPIERSLEERRERSEAAAEAAEGAAAGRTETVDRTAEALDMLRPASTTPEAAPAAAAPAATEAAEKKWYNPATWSPEDRTKAAQIAVIGTGVVGGLLLLRWIAGKTKKATEVVTEKAKSGFSFLKWAVIAGVVTAGGYFGWRGYSKYKERFGQMRTLERQIRELKQQGDKMSEEARAQLARLEEMHRRLREETEERESGAPDPITAPAVPEVVSEETKSQAINTLITHGVISFFEWDGWDLNKEAKYAQVKGLIENNRTLAMRDVFAVVNMTGEDVTVTGNPFKLVETDAENREKSAEYMLRFCAAFRAQVIEYIVRRERITEEEARAKVENMPLEEFVKEATASCSSVIPIVDEFNKSKGDMQQAMHNLDLRKITRGDVGVQREVELFLAEESGLTEDELANIGSAELLEAIFTYGSGGSVANKLLEAPTGTETKEQLVVRTILEKMKDSNTHLYMLPCFHGLLPTEEKGMSDEALVKTYLLDRMPAEQAVRFYLYKRMIDHGNPMGLILMQTEVVKFIADTEYFGVDKYRVCIRLMEKVGGGGVDEIVSQWKKLNIDVPPEFVENAAKGLGLVSGAAVYTAWEAATETFKPVIAAYLEHPIIAHTAMEAYRGYAVHKINLYDVHTGMAQWKGSVAGRTWMNTLRGYNPLMLSADDITSSAVHYSRMFDSISAVTDPEMRKSLEILLRQTLNAPFSKARWTVLAKALADNSALLGGNQAAESAVLFAKNRGMQSALNIQRFGAPSKLGFVIRTYERTRQTAIDAVKATPQALSAIKNSPWVQELAEQTGTKLDDLIQLLSRIEFPPALLQLFVRSKDSMTMLFNAAKGGAPALEYLVKIGSLAQKLGPALGKTLIGIDVLICAIEIAMNQKRIAETDNPALKELYGMRDRASVAGAVAGTAMGVAAYKTGFALTGAASWSTVGATTTAASFAPLVIAVFAAKYSADQLEAVSETWLSTEKDWLKKTSGELRERMAAMGPGQQTYWQQSAGGTRFSNWVNWATMSSEEYAKWQEEVFNTIENANEGARFTMTRAYLAQMSQLPQKEGETEAAYKERAAKYLSDQAMFLADASQGAFGLQLNGMYRAAPVHAELKALAAELKEKGGSQIIQIARTDENDKQYFKEFDLADYNEFKSYNDYNEDGLNALDIINAYQKQQRSLIMLQSAFLKETGTGDPDLNNKRDTLLQRSMLFEVRHELSQCEQKLREADLDGWDWTGGEEDTRDQLRYVTSVEFRKLLRAESDKLQAKELATPEDMEESVNALMAFLTRDAQQYVDLAKQGAYTRNAEVPGAVFMDRGWLADNLYVYPPSTKTA